MLKLKPPTHKIDGPAVLVVRSDTAWDRERIAAEFADLEARALVAAQDAAALALGPDATAAQVEEARAGVVLSQEQVLKARRAHPVERYQTGCTRFQLDADDWRPDGSPCTVRDYLKGPATEFSLRRVMREPYQAADEIQSTNARLSEFARLTLRAIRSADYTWQADPAQVRAPDEVLEVLHMCDPSLPLAIGLAAVMLARPLSDAEAFR